LTNPPVKVAAAAITGGNGNGTIDANECNSFNIVLTNASGLFFSAPTVTISNTTPHVIVTQPTSIYSNMNANAMGTNIVPFQISTLPTFPCGANIDLLVTVNSANGNFTFNYSLPTSCGVGGGFCDTCPGVVTNSISNADLVNNDRLARTTVASTCAAPTSCPGGVGGLDAPIHYDKHTFTNAGAATCVTVYLDSPCGLFASAYLGSFNPADLCANYLGDMGYNYTFGSFSFSVPANTNFVVVVNDVPSEGGQCDYTLVVTGTDCQPSLAIAAAPQSKVRLSWPTSAAGYHLESTPALVPANWAAVTNEPIVNAGKFAVTNSVGTYRFYRLQKP
jgi:hypothetical protein